MSNENPARGSHKLLAQLAAKGAAATTEEVKAALSLPANSDYKLLRWLIRGIPPIYFEVETTLQVQPKQLAGLVNHFAESSGIRDINILINGIPFPEIVNVTVLQAHSGQV